MFGAVAPTNVPAPLGRRQSEGEGHTQELLDNSCLLHDIRLLGSPGPLALQLIREQSQCSVSHGGQSAMPDWLGQSCAPLRGQAHPWERVPHSPFPPPSPGVARAVEVTGGKRRTPETGTLPVIGCFHAPHSASCISPFI